MTIKSKVQLTHVNKSGKITAHLEGNGDKDEGRSNSRSEYDDDNGEYKGLENEETDTSNAEYVDNYKYDNLLNVRSRNHKNEIPSSEELGEDNNKKSTTAGMDEKSQDDTENVKYDSEESSDSGSYEESDHKQRSLSPEIPIDHQGKLQNENKQLIQPKYLSGVQPIENSWYATCLLQVLGLLPLKRLKTTETKFVQK